MTTSLLMSKIIDLSAARRNRPQTDVQASGRLDYESRHESRRTANERLFIQIVDCPDPDLIGNTLSCHTVDVSPSGLRIHSAEYIPENCQMDVWIDNSARPGKFFLTGSARWVRSVEGEYQVGVALHDGATTDIDDWRQMLSRL